MKKLTIQLNSDQAGSLSAMLDDLLVLTNADALAVKCTAATLMAWHHTKLRPKLLFPLPSDQLMKLKVDAPTAFALHWFIRKHGNQADHYLGAKLLQISGEIDQAFYIIPQ